MTVYMKYYCCPECEFENSDGGYGRYIRQGDVIKCGGCGQELDTAKAKIIGQAIGEEFGAGAKHVVQEKQD
jgi:transcription elongation factor Elf1